MNLFGEQEPKEIPEDKGAVFSEDRKYRYALWRIWDPTKPLVMFIGVNPSTANEVKTDATITRVRNFASDWGYGGFYMMNLFGIVSKYPEVLVTDPNPVGDNNGWLEKIAARCSTVIFAWGAFKQAKERCKDVIAMFPDACCLKHNKDGSPMHPLMALGSLTPIKFANQGEGDERSVATM